MFIPFHAYPRFHGCCAILKGPSRPFWFCANKIFKELAKDNIASATKKAFRRDSFDLSRSEE
eukprot:14309238-Ditylum_brightwellii.AAC.1